MKRVLAIGVALAVAALAACGDGGSSSAKEGGQQTLTFAASTPLQWPHVWVSEKADLWKDSDVRAKVTLFQDGAQALQSLTSGAVDVATAAPTPLVAAINSGQKIRVIGVTDRWSKWRVVGNRSKGVNQPSDLRGKKVGVPLGTAAEASFNKFLQQNNLSAGDMKVINVAPPNIASALKTGSVDAVVVWVPHIVNAERSIGKDAVSFPYEFSSNYLLVTTQDVLDTKKAQLSSLLKVFGEANDMLANDPTKAAGMVTEVAGIDAATLEDIWKNEFTFDVVAPDAKVREEFETNIEFAKSKGTIPKDATIDLDTVLVDLTK